MKNKVVKSILLIFMILIVAMVISMVFNQSLATGNVLDDVDNMQQGDIVLPFGSEELMAWIIVFFRNMGIIISVVVLTILGLKFMMGSVQEKAEYKERLVPWIVGVLIVGFSSTILPSVIYNYITNSTGTDIKVAEKQIYLDRSNVTLDIGKIEEIDLKAIVQSKTETKEPVVWTSSNKNVATVDSNGKVKATGVGTTIIKAVCGDVETSCTIHVKSSKTTSVTISKTEITLDAPITNSYKLEATISPSTSTEPLSWSSSDKNVATVKNGKVRATGAGTAIITATSGEKSAKCKVTVNSSRVLVERYYNPSTKEMSSARTSTRDMGLVLYIPDVSKVQNVDKLPMIVYLHGGQTGSLGYRKSNNPFNITSKDYPAIILIPQSPERTDRYGWLQADNEQINTLKGIIDYAIANFNVDQNKIALTGFSNGGGGTWNIGLKFPKLFSCLVPVCGGSSKSASVYPDCPVWVICSQGDGTYSYAKTIGELMTNAGKKVKVDNRGSISHDNMEVEAYTPEVINWMIERSRETNSEYKFR